MRTARERLVHAPAYTTEVISTRTLAERSWAVEEAANLLRRGEIVALPTETVYGLAADARNPEAVAKIFEAKERPRFDPLIVHLPDASWLDRFTEIGEAERATVRQLTDAFWPGPLTLVLPKALTIPDIVTAGLTTVAVRVSAHPVFSEIIARFEGPLAAPSANRFGRISPTSAHHVAAELDGRVPLIIDSGATMHGLESTIVAVRNGRLEILRRGMITAEELMKFGEVVVIDSPETIETAGQTESHYAPRTPLMIAADISAVAIPDEERYGALVWSDVAIPSAFTESRRVSATGDLREAAANLFRELRELDAREPRLHRRRSDARDWIRRCDYGPAAPGRSPLGGVSPGARGRRG